MGLPGNVIDPLGDVQLFDRNSNGLATVAVDQVNRNTQFTYDSKGNITETLFEDGNSESATYNGDSQPLTITNAEQQYNQLHLQRRQSDGRRGRRSATSPR